MANSMMAFNFYLDQLREHRMLARSGFGAMLCLRGSQLRYVSLFFPLFRFSESEDLEVLGRYVSTTLSPLLKGPSELHPLLWRSAQVLALELAMRVINMPVALEALYGGIVAWAALLLDEPDHQFIAVSGIYTRWRSARSWILSTLGKCSSALVSTTLAAAGASGTTAQIAKLCSDGFLLSTIACYFARLDWATSLVVNAALGTELLQQGGRNLFPKVLSSPMACVSWDISCLVFGAWGAARQAWIATARFPRTDKSQKLPGYVQHLREKCPSLHSLQPFMTRLDALQQELTRHARTFLLL